MKKIVIALNHPAHYHLFKYVANEIKDTSKVVFFIKNKEILETLMKNENAEYLKYFSFEKLKKGKIKVMLFGFLELLFQDITLFSYCIFNKPSHLMGTDIAISHVGWILKIPSFILNEDDFEVNKYFCKLTYPFAKYIISPTVCNVSKWEQKKLAYEGYQKLAYLHPNRFTPDYSFVENHIGSKKYFLIRLVGLSAGHDIEEKHVGLSIADVRKIISILEKHGVVYISSEKPLDKSLEKYRLNFPVQHIHHLMYYSHLFISDSQSMTVECSVLGVPNIRVNTFVGKISVLEELEKKYKLTLGVLPENKTELFNIIEEYSTDNTLKNKFEERRRFMLQEKIDLIPFIIKSLKIEVTN